VIEHEVVLGMVRFGQLLWQFRVAELTGPLAGQIDDRGLKEAKKRLGTPDRIFGILELRLERPARVTNRVTTVLDGRILPWDVSGP
jgi:hypothetical protein